MTLKPTIAVVEDEEALLTLLQYNLEAEGYQVRPLQNGEEAEYDLSLNVPDLVILDWMLPGLSGFELCRRLRNKTATKNLPIIMLTARGEEGERVRGLDVGADDFMIKPFSMPELLARIKALLRRANPDILANCLSVGDLILDREKHLVFINKQEIKLGPIEFKLLEFFMRKPQRVYSRAQLLDNVWGNDNYIDERTVDVHIRRLRLAINHGDNHFIRTIRGAGYAFH